MGTAGKGFAAGDPLSACTQASLRRWWGLHQEVGWGSPRVPSGWARLACPQGGLCPCRQDPMQDAGGTRPGSPGGAGDTRGPSLGRGEIVFGGSGKKRGKVRAAPTWGLAGTTLCATLGPGPWTPISSGPLSHKGSVWSPQEGGTLQLAAPSGFCLLPQHMAGPGSSSSQPWLLTSRPVGPDGLGSPGLQLWPCPHPLEPSPPLCLAPLALPPCSHPAVREGAQQRSPVCALRPPAGRVAPAGPQPSGVTGGRGEALCDEAVAARCATQGAGEGGSEHRWVRGEEGQGTGQGAGGSGHRRVRVQSGRRSGDRRLRVRVGQGAGRSQRRWVKGQVAQGAGRSQCRWVKGQVA